jgi:hypothetical protein
MARMPFRLYVENVLKRTPYPYQEEIAEAVLDSVFNEKGLTISVLLARQMGKNETSALLESYLLTCIEEKDATIIKCAPTFKPQVINSRQRLLSMLDNPMTSHRVWKAFGYIVGVVLRDHAVDSQIGPRVMFFSANPDSSIVGATASHLLEVDEAQDVSVEKFNRDLRPMASTKNATTILYGTAWSEDSLLAQVKTMNLELEEQDGVRRHFQYDWRTLAAIKPTYKAFVEKEMRRLGEDHPTIRTQYRLLPIAGLGYLLNDLQRHLLDGRHKWQEEPDEDEDDYYVAGMDVGGEDRSVATGRVAGSGAARGKRDATVVSIARVLYNALALPSLEVVHQYWFTGMLYADQYAIVSEIMQRWNIRKLVVDATGLGEALASLLIDRFPEDRVIAFKFSRSSKSKLTYQFLSVVNGGRLQLYARDGAPEGVYDECWKQIRLARYRVPGENLLDMYVPSEEGHDDFLMSLALCCEGTREWRTPVVESAIIRPEPLYPGEGWY